MSGKTEQRTQVRLELAAMSGDERDTLSGKTRGELYEDAGLPKRVEELVEVPAYAAAVLTLLAKLTQRPGEPDMIDLQVIGKRVEAWAATLRQLAQRDGPAVVTFIRHRHPELFHEGKGSSNSGDAAEVIEVAVIRKRRSKRRRLTDRRDGGKRMQSIYASKCAECKGNIAKGSNIVWYDAKHKTRPKTVMHAQCAPSNAPPTPPHPPVVDEPNEGESARQVGDGWERLTRSD